MERFDEAKTRKVKRMKIIALDYDGVIVDSDIKYFIIGYNAFLKAKNGNPTPLLEGRFLSYEDSDKIKEAYPEEVHQYYQMRPFCRMATDYGVIFLMMESHKMIDNQADFDVFKEKSDFPWDDYYDYFFEEKDKADHINTQKNLSLEPVYPEIITGCQKMLQDGLKVVITSLNIRPDIARYLHSPEIALNIPWEDIFDHRFGYDKVEQMKKIVEIYAVSFQDIYFIDDQIDHLYRPMDLGIQVFLAGWSYANAKQIKMAREQGMPVVANPGDFYEQLKKYMKIKP